MASLTCLIRGQKDDDDDVDDYDDMVKASQFNEEEEDVLMKMMSMCRYNLLDSLTLLWTKTDSVCLISTF